MAQACGDRADGGLVEPTGPPSARLLLAVHHDRYRQLLRTFLGWKRRAHTQWRSFVAERRQRRREGNAVDPLQDEEKQSLEDQALSGGWSVDVDEESHAGLYAFGGEMRDQDVENILNLQRKQRYFEWWRLASKKDMKVASVGVIGVTRISSLHAIKRWRRFARMKKDRSVVEQRAYFFLYYWLLKRSLSCLSRHALVKRREHTLTVKIVKASRQQLLVKSMQLWRLRLRLHQTLALWRGYMQRRKHQALLYRPIADVLKRKNHRRLLQLTFDTWEKRHARNHAQSMLIQIVDRQLYRKVCEKAWRIWRSKVRQLTQLDLFQRGYHERRLHLVWKAWSDRAREKERQDQRRRHAVRTHYLSLLRMGFNGFRAWRAQQQLALDRVENMLDVADNKLLASAFSCWDHFTSGRKLRALNCERAVHHAESQLVNRVWANGFRRFFSRTLLRKKLKLAAHEHHYIKTVRRSFCAWTEAWRAERTRDQTLQQILQGHKTMTERATKAVVLNSWSEFTRAKAARRVVNAQMRGQAQRRMLQKYLSQWVTYVSLLRWQQITQARAEQHFKTLISRKCFERWRNNVILRQRYRKKTRVALVHWKLALQRKAFDGWKKYLHTKKMKQQHFHEALEFRHGHFVREGLRHWMTAALHMQEQREKRVACAQASNTTHIWRRVAVIARHWRYLAIRRRTIKEEGHVLENRRNAPRQVHEDVYWPPKKLQPGRAQSKERPSVPPPGSGKLKRQRNLPFDDAENSNWTNERSPLSEFVLLPRNRPQPRRPVEVLLLSQVDTENLPRSNAHTNVHEAVRCGFDFPAETFARLSSPPCNEAKLNSPRKLLSTAMIVSDRKKCQSPLAPVMPSREGEGLLLPSNTARQLDVLERQLQALSERKKEWKNFQEHIEVLREASDTKPGLMPKLRSMEEQHEVRTKQWLHTRERIRSVAMEIQQLRSALQQ